MVKVKNNMVWLDTYGECEEWYGVLDTYGEHGGKNMANMVNMVIY